MTYHSPILHHVLLNGLQPGQRYWYRVGGRLANGSAAPDSQEWSFLLPAGPPAELRVGVLGDPGKLEVAPAVEQLAVLQCCAVVGAQLRARARSPAAAVAEPWCSWFSGYACLESMCAAAQTTHRPDVQHIPDTAAPG